jgi:hypothetical protein
MVRHCAEALRGALGEVHSKPLGRRLLHTRLMKHLIFRVLPFPKGASTAPELRIVDPADFHAERPRLIALVGRYGSPPAGDFHAEHPLFGVLTWEEWGEIEYKHIDHHLRQFGV